MRTFKRMMSLVLVCIMAMVMLAFPASAAAVTGNYVFRNALSPYASYERVVHMNQGGLLATWCKVFPPATGNWDRGNDHFVFFSGYNNDSRWRRVSILKMSDYGYSNKQGMPALFVLPQQCGDFPAGTILFATNDWDVENETYGIHIWRSTDNGKTWQKHGDLAPRPAWFKDKTDPEHRGSVWEPEFAVSADGRLVCYYSDEMQKGYDQCLAMEISDDGGLTWSGYKIIVGTYHKDFIRGITPSQWRPGMPRVTRMTNGTYVMAYENICGGHRGQVSVIFSEDGINWGDPTKPGAYVEGPGGVVGAYQCPTIACIDDGSTYGRLFLRGMNDTCSPSQCFTSTDGGRTWDTIDAPLSAYRDESRGLSWSGTFLAKDNRLYEVNNIFNGSYNEIRCGMGLLIGDQMFIDGAEYAIKTSCDYGLCLDGSGESIETGKTIILQEENLGDTQRWRLRYVYNNYFMLESVDSNKVIEDYFSAEKVGDPLVLQDGNVSPGQCWEFVPTQNGHYLIHHEGCDLYLDYEGEYVKAGAKIVQNRDNVTNHVKSWFVTRIYDIRLRSNNISDCHVYINKDKKALIANKDTSLSLSASEWRIVPGLADSSCISFESLLYPGWYLRHSGGQLMISEYDDKELFKQDATWYLREALDGSYGVSFESFNKTGQYIRHRDSYLYISEISNNLDRQDATFHMEMQ